MSRPLHPDDPVVREHVRLAEKASADGDHMIAAYYWTEALSATGAPPEIIAALKETIAAGYGHDVDCRCPDCLHADAAAQDAHDARVAGIEHGEVI